MKYTLVRESTGRLRFRVGKYVFNQEQGQGLSALLLSLSGVISVETSPQNGGIFVCHDHTLHKQELFDLLKSLRELPEESLSPEAIMIQQEQQFRLEVGKVVLGHYARKYLLPSCFAPWVAWCRSIPFLFHGISALCQRKLSVELLDATAIGTSLLMKDYTTASSTMFLLKISDLLLGYSNVRAKNQLTKSLAISPVAVWRIKEGAEEQIPMEQLLVGDVIRLRTGAQIPVDGELISGDGMVNESSMTGEPLPVHKKEGSTVFAGTVLEEGELDVRVRNLCQNSRISKIVDFIQSGEESKAQIQGKAEKLADNIVPISFGFFFATWLVTRNLARATSVLMVDFSCAIKLTTPISVISALKEAAEAGIVVKGGKYLEALAQVDCIVFDKTGTLTEAVPKVSKVISLDEQYSEEEILSSAACLEEHFPHSVAAAIVAEAKNRDLSHPEYHGKVEYIVAHGIVSTQDNQKYAIGSRHFVVEDEGVPLSPDTEAFLAQEIGVDSAVYLAIGETLVGVICIHDPPRPEAERTLAQLRALGISDMMMITGDNENTARHVAETLGLSAFEASVLPDGKARSIQRQKELGKTVLMVGDGINDAPGLSCANVSMTLAGSSDLAREVADISILSENLESMVLARELATALMEKIARHYAWIVAFNSVLIALGMGGLLTASQTALYHNLSTFSFAALSTRPLLNQ